MAPLRTLVSAALTAAALATVAAVTIGAGIAPADAASGGPVVRTPEAVRSASVTTLYPGGLWTDPASQPAAAVARLTAAGRTSDAQAIGRIASQPIATWLGDWYQGAQLTKAVAKATSQARVAGRTAVFVTYAVPNRDCGSYSAGGLDLASYLSWNKDLAAAMKGTGSAVIVEPDGLAQVSGGSCAAERPRRLQAISGAVDILTRAGLTVYLDAGNSNWLKPADMAALLNQAGIAKARGFATNTSNFQTLAAERAYADQVSTLTGGSHYVVDVSRNGAGWKGTWCNPVGAALGQNPQVTPNSGALDATLWVKTPGASDGTCNGGPAAGQWWDDYALALVRGRG